MTRQQLLAALAAAAGMSISSTAGAVGTYGDVGDLERAAERGAIGIQAFLHKNPDSPLTDQAVKRLFELADVGDAGDFISKARGFERSGNPNAAGSPDNPGVGNPHTPDC